MSKASKPLPERLEVNCHSLAMLLNALNGQPHEIRELQVTRGFGLNLGLGANPIDVLERELMTAQNPPEGQVYLDAVAEAEDFASGELRNHKRQGIDIDAIIALIDGYCLPGPGLRRQRLRLAILEIANGK